jgi:uncharacterized protein YbcC (UPF0753/DUF2309 family)
MFLINNSIMSKFANTFLKSLNEETEKLHGGQKNIDVAEPKGKITGADFAALRKKKGLKKEETEGNAFSKAVQDAKAAGKKPGDKIKVGGKDVTLREKHKMSDKKKKAMKENYEMEAAPAPSGGEMSDEEAYKRSLDKGTNPKDFDVADNPQLKVDSSGVDAARNWISKLEEMADFVNGTGPESLNSQINQLEIKNSIPFRGVVRREEKRITKLAENLRGLAEVFKSVVITSEKKVKDASTPR